MDNVVKISNQPMLIDHNGEAQAWLDKHMPSFSDDPFFHPRVGYTDDLSGYALDTHSYLEQCLPELPPIRVGCLQWPCVGASRFARGLYLADKSCMKDLYRKAYGIDPETPVSDWITTNPARLVLTIGETTISVLLRNPICISEELWLIPVVDVRFLLRIPLRLERKESTIPDRTWSDFFDKQSSGAVLIHPPESIPDAFANPDATLFESRNDVGLTIDYAAYSLGLRPVCNLRSPNGVGVVFESHSQANAKRDALIQSAKVTGGYASSVTRFQKIYFDSPRALSFFLKRSSPYTLHRSNVDSVTNFDAQVLTRQYHHRRIGTSGEHSVNAAAPGRSAYFDTIAATYLDSDGWGAAEYYVCLPGLVEITPGGHDDYIEWDVSPNGPVTRVKSLPSQFIPRAFLSQHPATNENTGDPSYWFATERVQIFGQIVSDPPAGSKSENTGHWKNIQATVQLIDKDLFIDGSLGLYRNAEVKALVATEDELKAGDIVSMHFSHMPYDHEGDVKTFEGWVIHESKSDILVRFTLTSALSESGSATATINSIGDDDGDTITVYDWASGAAAVGSKGIAWSDGSKYWIVEIVSDSSANLVRFTLNDDLDANGSAPATINSTGPNNGTNITVTDWTGKKSKSGWKGIAWAEGDNYWVVEILEDFDNQDDDVVTAFVLTADAYWGPHNTVQTVAANILNTDGTTAGPITVKIIGRSRAKSGCRGVAVKKGAEWIVSEIQQPVTEAGARLRTLLTPEDLTTNVVFLESSIVSFNAFPNDRPIPTVVTEGIAEVEVDNPLRLCGWKGARVTLQYNAETDRYFIESIERQAFIASGTVQSGFTGTDSDVFLEDPVGIDGELSPESLSSSLITAKNIHKLSGATDATARAEFNWALARWELVQVEKQDDSALAFTAGGATARSGTTLGTGTAALKTINSSGVIVDAGSSVTFRNWSASAVAASRYIWLEKKGGLWIVVNVECVP